MSNDDDGDYDSSLSLWQCENKEPHDWHVVIDKVKNYECMGNAYPWGLCANKDDHRPHPVFEGTLAPFFCTAHQDSREPYRSEQRRAKNG